MAWTDSIKVIKTGIAYESTAGTAETAPQEYTYINNDGVLNCPREFDEFRAHSSRSVTFSIPKAYHTTGTFSSWVFPETNGFGYWLSGALGTDGTPVQHGTLPYIHTISAASTQIPSYTMWMKTGVYEYKSYNNQVNRLTLNQAKNSVLAATVETIGSELAVATDFGTAAYVTDANDCFTSQKAYVNWGDTPTASGSTWSTNMSDLTLTIDNGIDANEPKILGKTYADHILAGNRSVTGSATMFVESTNEIEDYWGGSSGPSAITTTVPLRFTWWSDTIETSNTVPAAAVKTHTGGGTSTVACTGTYTGTGVGFFELKCTTDAAADKFRWRKNFGTWSEEVTVTGSAQTLQNGVDVTFNSTENSKVGDRWCVWTGDRPYVLDIDIPAARITSFDQQSTGNRLSAKVNFTGQVSSTYSYDIKAFLINQKSTTYNA